MHHGGPFDAPNLFGPALRYLIGGAALLLGAAAVVVLLVLPPLFDQEQLAARVDAAVLAWTGQPFSATDGVDLTLLPQPVLTVHRPELGGAEAGFMLAADRLDLDLRLWPLLLGSFSVDRAYLVRPEWRLAEASAGSFAALVGRLAERGGHLPIGSLELTDGTIATAVGEPLVQEIDARVERGGEGAGSRFRATGKPAAAAATQLRLEGELGAAGAGRPVPLRLEGEALSDGVVHRLGLRGELRPEREVGGLTGQLTLDLPAAAAPLEAALVDIWPSLDRLPFPELATQLEADLDLALRQDGATLRLDEATLALGEQALGGALLLELGALPSIDLRLEADRFDLAPGGFDLVSLGEALPPALVGSIGLRADVVIWRERAFRRLVVDLGLDGQGTVEVERATAVLPGPGDVTFSGRFDSSGSNTRPGLTGRLQAALQAPAELIAAVAEPPALLRRSTMLTLSTDLDWRPGVLTLQNADLGIDALQAVGGLAYRPAAAGRQAQLALRAEVDRLALDDLVDEDVPEATLNAILDLAAATDLAVDLRVSRASLGPTRLGELAARLESRAGAVAIEQLRFDDVAGSAASVSGRVHAPSRTFELDLALDVASLSRLVRLLGREPPLALALLGPLNLRGELAGDSERAQATMRLEADQFTAEGSASLTEWQSEPSGALLVSVETEATATLLRQLGGVAAADPLLLHPLRAELEIEVEAGSPRTAVLRGSSGALALTLEAARRTAGPGPFQQFDVELGPLSSARAALLYRLLTPPLDLVPGPPARWLGYWPAQELSWDWLGARDAADVAVTVVGTDPALPPVEIRAQLRDGRLTVPALRWASPDGLIDAGIAMVARPDGSGVDLGLDLALERFAADRLLAFWGLPPATLDGDLDLEGQLATHGDSLRRLIGNLRGRLDLVVSDGALAAASPSAGGIPFERLGGGLAVERGTVALSEPGIAFSGPDGVGRISGSLDLLAWMADLAVELDDQDGMPVLRQEVLEPLSAPSEKGAGPALPVD